jgi:hypothetical protein
VIGLLEDSFVFCIKRDAKLKRSQISIRLRMLSNFKVVVRGKFRLYFSFRGDQELTELHIELVFQLSLLV